MRHPLLGTLRRQLVFAVTLVAAGTGALAAAHLSASPEGAPPELLGYDSSIAATKSGDIHLSSSVVPFFNHSASPAAVQVRVAEHELALPVSAAPAAAAHTSSFGGFTSSNHTATSSPRRRGASSGNALFTASIGGMSMGGAWGGVSGTASTAPHVAPASSVVQKSTGGSRTKAATEHAAQASGHRAGAATQQVNFTDHVANPPATAAAATHPPVAGEAAPVAQQHPGTPTAPQQPRQQAPHPGGPAPVPEPMTMLLVGVGAVGLYALRRHLK